MDTITDKKKIEDPTAPVLNPDPEKILQAFKDVQFQMDNVEGWLSVKNYDWAELKAACIIKAAHRLHQALVEYNKK